jgi:hypothetical protein
VITVGAVDTKDTAIRSDDTVARFSSRGPTRFDMVLKPDLVAPGTRVTSAEAAGSYLARTYPQRHVAGDGANAYIQLSGTSMAAGVVSGTAALLLELNHQFRTQEVKALVQLTSAAMATQGLVSSGAGSLNAAAAAALAVRPRISAIGNSIAGEPVQARGLSYTNTRVHLVKVDSDGDREPNGFLALVRFSRSRQEPPHFNPHARSVYRYIRMFIWAGLNTSNSIIWNTFESIVWDTSDSIVWDTSDSIVWDTSDSIVWDTSDSIVWDTSDSIVWDTAQGVSDSDLRSMSSSGTPTWNAELFQEQLARSIDFKEIEEAM